MHLHIEMWKLVEPWKGLFYDDHTDNIKTDRSSSSSCYDMYKEEEEKEEEVEVEEDEKEEKEEGSPVLPVLLLVWGRSGDLGASSVQGGASCRGEVQEPSQSSYTSCHTNHVIYHVMSCTK
jgi:hypothetical protein